MLRRIIALLILMLTLHTGVSAQEEAVDDSVALSYLGYNPFDRNQDKTVAHDIDSIYFEKMHQSGQTTMGELEAYDDMTVIAEQLIQKEYKFLLANLDSTDRKLFKTAHTRWKAYYSSEKDFLYSAFYTWSNFQKYDHGREHSTAQAEWIFKLARQRLIAIRVFAGQI